LALFGRRPPQHVEEFVMPASKNLHNNGPVSLENRFSLQPRDRTSPHKPVTSL